MTTPWTEDHMPDQTGRVAIVTGSNSGIGWEAARALANKGATVIMACRSIAKANLAADQIKALKPSGKVVGMALDLGDLASVRAFAAAFRQDYDRLDLLINNGGVAKPPYGKTAQGFEQQFGINHLGHFALTGLLLERLDATPGARIVTVSSLSHRSGIVHFDDLNLERNYKPARAYAQSKLANLLFTYELQRRLVAAGRSTLAVAVHPGWTATNALRHSSMMRRLNPIFAQTSKMGVLPTLYAATASDVRGGDYFGPSSLELRGYPKKVESSARSHDEAVARRLWTISEELTQVKYALAPAPVFAEDLP
ncbi:SDR family NAD(P)-dependent oxidoreductase [Paenibacillus macerans]|uniref:SDR family NAD(P)-dependent oxidoreductase n=1 Tax=Paenibacillus macerans TaxID=44252 RepID=A0A6N8F3N0_PAEMA|nr:oxidoreductase [Paenibacillus macerans]MUG25348.1 SDR family NAD(P)-dependent oxidoreductase [Paenibacillus macerans]UMV45668.1 SDR family NAD(P)-dependent oxidoreductase [Paenibacillus macerans]